jgi:hypothetical protein
MSRTLGVLQVKTINIPGLEDGELCIPWNYLNTREYFFGLSSSRGITRQTWNDIARGNHTIPETLDVSDVSCCCNRCKAGKQSWSSEANWFVCGEVE